MSNRIRKYPSDFKEPWNSEADAMEDYKRSIESGEYWVDNGDGNAKNPLMRETWFSWRDNANDD